jgi:hypothetical protein
VSIVVVKNCTLFIALIAFYPGFKNNTPGPEFIKEPRDNNEKYSDRAPCADAGIRQKIIDGGIPDPGPVGAFSFSHVMVTKSLLFVTVTDGTQ